MNRVKKATKTILAIAVTLVFLSTGAMADLRTYKQTSNAGPYAVTLKLDKKNPVVGDNIATIEIKDADGKYVLDAKVVLEYSMPAMPGMPAMNYKANAKQNAEEFIATMNLPMAGAWNVAVKVTRNNKTESAKYNVDAK
ncbi:MAG: FixH family protein [Nitrospirae bacterium]|nr:FixH family protein [Nitrospirota bacterium]